MRRYPVQHRDRKSFLDFRLFGKYISENLSHKYSQKLLDHVTQSATDALKTASKIVVQKIAGATGDLIGNKIAEGITEVSKSSPQNNSETV